MVRRIRYEDSIAVIVARIPRKPLDLDTRPVFSLGSFRFA